MSEAPRIRWRGGRPLALLGIALLGVILLGRVLTGLYFELLWFQTVDYTGVFWRRAFWEWSARVLGGLVVGLTIVLNLRVVARTLHGIKIRRRFGDLEISEQLPRSYVVWTITLTAVLLALWFGASIPRSVGLELLFLRTAPEWGITDPILGKDLMFYVVTLPVQGAAVTFALVLSFLVFTLCAAGYAATGALQFGKNRVLVDRQARVHLAWVVASFFVLLAVRFWLSRYFLLRNGSSEVQGIFGYTDAHARLTAFRVLTVLSMFAAIGAVWSGLRGRLLPFAAGLIGLVGGGIVIGQMYPSLSQRLVVQPNELERETPYIEHNMRFTRLGFGLDRLERRSFEHDADEPVDWEDVAAQVRGLALWSSDALLKTFDEVDAGYTYYDFSQVAIDRYPTPEGVTPVALAVREVNTAEIPDPNWQNRHLRLPYIAGRGAVASRASTKTPEGRPEMFLKAIPVEFTEGIAPEALRLSDAPVFISAPPRITGQRYVVLNPETGSDTTELGVTFYGEGREGVDYPRGIRLSSLVRKLALAWHFKDANLVLASELTDTSLLLVRRSVVERVQRITGNLLRFPEDPYAIVHDGHIVWMLEGFTGTRWFPLSSEFDLMFRRPVRYARNSVKITVDSRTGAVAFYAVDPEDRLLQVYQRGFPGLFRPIDEMPDDLRAHLRYPRTMMTVQSNVLHRYHQSTAAEFHRQQDVWAQAEELQRGANQVRYLPEYGVYRAPGDLEPSFLLTTVFVPAGRQNLAALLVARNDPERYGELTLYQVAREDLVRGPRQIEALVEQDPRISEQFSLWRQGGSEVWTGHLHVVPVGKSLVYVEPVFLAASDDAIPELQRFVVSDGRRIAMEPTLSGAIARMAGFEAPVGGPRQPAAPSPDVTPDRTDWPAEALDLLDEAERRLRTGDYQGFGEALAELRKLLSRLEASGGTG